MSNGEIERLLIDAVLAIQKMSGRKDVAMTASTRPLLDIPDFDSLNGVEATIETGGKLNFDIPFNNIFLNESKRALSIKEAAVRLARCLPTKSKSTSHED